VCFEKPLAKVKQLLRLEFYQQLSKIHEAGLYAKVSMEMLF
jgi:hypothetical protein